MQKLGISCFALLTGEGHGAGSVHSWNDKKQYRGNKVIFAHILQHGRLQSACLGLTHPASGSSSTSALGSINKPPLPHLQFHTLLNFFLSLLYA